VTSDDIIRRGMAAARLLGDETLVQALAEIEAECANTWANSNPADVTAREDAYRMNRCVALLRHKLESWRGAAQIEKNNAALRLRDARSI
jgi:hypothetical protein